MCHQTDGQPLIYCHVKIASHNLAHAQYWLAFGARLTFHNLHNCFLGTNNMAATAIVNAKAKEDFVDEFLTCAICTELYDNDEHQAKCLPCLHTYCKSCLQCYAGMRPKFNCPKCCCLIPLPNGTVDSLPNNFIVENLKENQGILDRSVLCGNCDDDNPAVKFCHDCGSFQCQRCADNHQVMRSMQHHHLATLEELQGKKCKHMSQQQLCLKHPKQDLTLYCREADCKVPVCASCGLVDHRDHDLIDLSAAVDEIKEEMHRSSARLTSRNEELVKKKAIAKTNQTILTDNYRQKEQDLNSSEQTLIASIRSRFTEARSHLQLLYQSEMSRLSSEIESIDLLTLQMSSASEFVDTACDMSHPMQLVTSQNQIMDRLRELENEEFSELAQDKTNFEFTARHHSGVEQINELLPNVGDMDWEIENWDDKMKWERENRDDELSGRTKSTQFTKTFYGGQFADEGQASVPDMYPQREGVWQKGISFKEAFNKGQRDNGVKVGTMPGRNYAIPPSRQNTPAVDPSCCTITFHSQTRPGPSVSQTLRGAIKTADSNARLIKKGGALVDVKHGVYPLPVCDNGDGSYQFDCVLSGQPDLDNKLYITINGVEMKGSPYSTAKLEESPSKVDPSRCTINFENVRTKYYQVVIQLADSQGQTIPRHVATVKAVTNDGRQLQVVAENIRRMTSGRQTRKLKKAEKPQAGLAVTDPAAGIYSITFPRKLASSIHVWVNGDPMRGSPYTP